jgi:hypothetical protein
MKRRNVLVYLTFPSSTALSQSLMTDHKFKVGDILPIPAEGFSHSNEIDVWAKSSSFGGGRATELTSGVFCTVRSATSGRPTSEVILFTASEGKYRPKLIVPMQPYEAKFSVRDNKFYLSFTVDKIAVPFLELSLDALTR